jgi:hypothetical protein
VHIDDKAVSRKHATLTFRNKQARAALPAHARTSDNGYVACLCVHTSLRLTLRTHTAPRCRRRC